ncbi:coiled-coil domain-containing protein 42 like-2 isoform X2 [Haplochromis burtoni]|uniref:coiled-coil domain-containing protein 42 like-2 isoform X2 n=1 Tax=Haplochromis burtoni TaxID=8153 RepID=UPI001C2D96B3|nr:coiled-coil domain-containing protein 42 like-2 isoform X2 [Haplochromis burtoni]
MTTHSLPFLENSPGQKLQVGNGVNNIFVTQSQDSRREDDANHIPVLKVPSSRVLEAGVTTLQKTLVLKKQAELDEVEKRLALKRLDFKACMEALAQRRSELEIKLQETKEKVGIFEKFVAENEAKRRRALKSCEASRAQNIFKKQQIKDLTEQLKGFRDRRQVLKERVAKYKIYEDYLIKTRDYLPSNYLDDGSESLVMPIIRRHETLSITHQELLQRLQRMEAEVEEGQRQLQDMKEEHSVKKLMANKELSELQSELETLKEKNKQAEVNLQMEQDLSREKVPSRLAGCDPAHLSWELWIEIMSCVSFMFQVTEVGRLLMAISNLAEQCYLPEYRPLEKMNALTMMDMEYILDKVDTERRARRMMELGSLMTSTTAAANKRERGSMRSFGSKTQIKSSSKVSRSSETFG